MFRLTIGPKREGTNVEKERGKRKGKRKRKQEREKIKTESIYLKIQQLQILQFFYTKSHKIINPPLKFFPRQNPYHSFSEFDRIFLWIWFSSAFPAVSYFLCCQKIKSFRFFDDHKSGIIAHKFFSLEFCYDDGSFFIMNC